MNNYKTLLFIVISWPILIFMASFMGKVSHNITMLNQKETYYCNHCNDKTFNMNDMLLSSLHTAGIFSSLMLTLLLWTSVFVTPFMLMSCDFNKHDTRRYR